jgi:uncharacterized protein GlcG (DUF336 family)
MNLKIMAGLLLLNAATVASAAELSTGLALEAAQEAVESCKKAGYEVTATVVDVAAVTKVVLRADGARDGTVQVAYRKAYTVIKSGMTSGEFGKSVAPQPSPPPGSPPGPVNGDPNLITWAGGLPIKVGSTTIGALAVSGAPGGEKDEACVQAGLAKIASRLK